MFPLGTVLFPGAVIPLHVFEPRYRALMHDCLEADRRFGVVLIERGSEVGGGDQRATVGTQGIITQAAELPDGRWVLEVTGERPVDIIEWLPDDPYPMAVVSERTVGGDEGDLEELLRSAAQRVRKTRALLAENGGAPALSPDQALDGGGDIHIASWQLCGNAPLSTYDAQRLLADDDVAQRLSRLTQLMEELELDLQRMLAPE
jgi:Lon protease-like protein